jgi:hypothetical protein
VNTSESVWGQKFMLCVILREQNKGISVIKYRVTEIKENWLPNTVTPQLMDL